MWKVMQIFRSKEFKPEQAWGAKEFANMNGITTGLHWTHQPYKWPINDGEEIFVVLDGIVEMFFKENGMKKSAILETGDIFYAAIATEHVAHPHGESRILVVGS
tara:strand:+ start:5075 stop:5386 length:312 start_codon:yes stop_codon:yes gene_type:complete